MSLSKTLYSLLRTTSNPQRESSFEHPKQMLNMSGKKIFTLLCSKCLFILTHKGLAKERAPLNLSCCPLLYLDSRKMAHLKMPFTDTSLYYKFDSTVKPV